MTFADETFLAALVEQRTQALDTGFGPFLERIQLAEIFGFAEQWANLFEVLPHRRNDRIGTA